MSRLALELDIQCTIFILRITVIIHIYFFYVTLKLYIFLFPTYRIALHKQYKKKSVVNINYNMQVLHVSLVKINLE